MLKEGVKRGLTSPFQKQLDMSTYLEFYGTSHKKPHFVVNIGKACYTNNLSIVIGLNHDTFEWCEDEVDEWETADYVRGHECQHIKSTTDKSWRYGLDRGTKAIVEYLVKENRIPIRLISDASYDEALKKLSEKGYRLSVKTLQKLVHFIMNSLEDGRIESIRASANDVFKKQMVHIRLLSWSLSPIEGSGEIEDMNAAEKLQIILNQILSLATTSVYQKGFGTAYYGTEIQERLDELIPDIAAGVTAKRCRECMSAGIRICEKLADLIAEASKYSELEILLMEFLKQISEDFTPSAKEGEEECGNGETSSPFGHSDLYIVLPDEIYDELVKNKGDSEDGEPGIQIRREHPKEEQNKEKQNEEKQGSGNKEGQESENKESGCEEESKGKENDSSTGECEESKKSESEESGGSKGSGNECESSSKPPSKGDAGTSQEDTVDDDKESGEKPSESDVERKIREAMEKAAEEAQGNAKNEAENAITQSERQDASQTREVDVKEPVKPTDTTRINTAYKESVRLIEEERSYEVEEPLPLDLQKEIDAFSKKIEQYMKSAKKKWRKFINSGKLDSSRTAMLGANCIDVFKESRVSNGTSACAEMLLDNSGSMGYGEYSKRYYACRALTKIEMCFARYFPIKIVAFDATGIETVVHEIIKGWNERFSKSAAYNFLIKGRYGSGNKDGYSIRVAAQDLATRPEKRKLLVVLSDGAPTGYRGNGNKDVEEAVKEARKAGITVVGIYFSSGVIQESERDSFAKMYQKNYIITTPDKIEDELAKVMKIFFL